MISDGAISGVMDKLQSFELRQTGSQSERIQNITENTENTENTEVDLRSVE